MARISQGGIPRPGGRAIKQGGIPGFGKVSAGPNGTKVKTAPEVSFKPSIQTMPKGIKGEQVPHMPPDGQIDPGFIPELNPGRGAGFRSSPNSPFGRG